ncbi:MAG: GIDE domain-containing protein [Haloferacaceae archaeon]
MDAAVVFDVFGPLSAPASLGPLDTVTALTAAAGFGLLVVGFAALFRAKSALRPVYRILRNEPTPVRELVYHSGPAEIEGTAAGDEKGVTAPFTGKTCLAYEYEVQELRSSGKSNYWETLDEGGAAAPFLVEDETGTVQVDGPAAELHLEAHTLRLDPGEEPPPRIAEYLRESEDVDPQDRTIDLVVTELNVGNDQKFIERRLDVGESVHVYGHVERAPAGEWGSGVVDALLTAGEETPLVVSDTSERGAAWRLLKSRLRWPMLALVSLIAGGSLLVVALAPVLA